MIITKTPFRISFAGGGSDLPSFYRREPGAVLSTSIDKYMYIAIHPFFNQGDIQLKYSKTEMVSSIEDIKHPIFREILSKYNLTGVDINSIADIPAGTGMGSSSSFTVGVLNAVRAFEGKYSSASKLAEEACDIEMNRLAQPIGKQDQYAAAFGGLNFITFYPDETVRVEKILIQPDVKAQLEKNLMLVYVGGEHSANEILQQQAKATTSSDDKFLAQRRMVKLANDLRVALQENKIDDFGSFLHEGWLLKRSLTNGISNGLIDTIYNKGMEAGALGGKLLGAGGAGFLLFYCPEQKQQEFKEQMNGYRFLNFGFDNFGSQVIYVGDKNF